MTDAYKVMAQAESRQADMAVEMGAAELGIKTAGDKLQAANDAAKEARENALKALAAFIECLSPRLRKS